MELLNKIEIFIKKLRWKALYFDNGSKDDDSLPENNDGPMDAAAFSENTYGLKTTKCPPPVKDLADFEKDLLDIMTKIKFRKVECIFQKQMQRDMKDIRKSEKVLVFADKTSNMYKVPIEEYKRILHNAVTNAYKKSNDEAQEAIIKEGKTIAKKFNVVEKMNKNIKSECFVTLKDHKENFANKLPARLINPSKNEIGRISKAILDRINKELRKTINVQQWSNTNDVIHWFNGLENKSTGKFMVFDIKDFYPSITEEVLKLALEFASEIVTVKPQELEAVRHARKWLLFKNGESWAKRENENFDVSMGAYDGAEICELVGMFLLKELAREFNKENIGLYRDDGLAYFSNITARQADIIRKRFCEIFKQFGFKLEIQCNMKQVDYLDVTFNLTNGTYKPFKKPNNSNFYINVKSNHPRSIIEQIPATIEKRISELSSNQAEFDGSVEHYQDSLRKNGYKRKLQYQSQNKRETGAERKRSRKIIWFNPPFSKTVVTNVGKYFLSLVDKHFKRDNKYAKIFNKNTLKISYSCMPNVKTIINAHNRKILRQETEPNEKRTCNCSKKENCPLSNKCLSTNIVYEAKISCDDEDYKERSYFGISEGAFKLRYANHKKSFTHEKYKNETELSKEFWSIKNKGKNPKLTWKIVRQCRPFNPATRRCDLCLSEKYSIIKHRHPTLLNRRSELISKCRHVNKHLFSSK